MNLIKVETQFEDQEGNVVRGLTRSNRATEDLVKGIYMCPTHESDQESPREGDGAPLLPGVTYFNY